MVNKTIIATDESIAAIKLDGEWHFHYDIDYMFILDVMKYDYPDGEVPQPEDLRYATLLVGRQNVTQWMNSLRGKLAMEQVANTFREGNKLPCQLNYVIDFDERTWVGQGWNNDQINLADYQPDNWSAKQGDPYLYLPSELRQILSI